MIPVVDDESRDPLAVSCLSYSTSSRPQAWIIFVFGPLK